MGGGLGLKGSVSEQNDIYESVRSKYLLLGEIWMSYDRQVRMTMNLAVKMEDTWVHPEEDGKGL